MRPDIRTECTGLRPGTRPAHHGRVLTDADRALLTDARRAVLATIAPDGRGRLVPVCYVVDADRELLYSPLDEKPKRSQDALALARVRDIDRDPRVTLLVDRWDEDWTRLAWLRLDGRAALFRASDPGHTNVIAALRGRYPQYERQRLEERPMIEIAVERVARWSLSDERSD
jgi:PPOX class probable F420-dependent enzyme